MNLFPASAPFDVPPVGLCHGQIIFEFVEKYFGIHSCMSPCLNIKNVQ